MKYCQYCGKECKSNLSLGCHEVRCKQNPNRKIWNSWKPSCVWNKGLTKETDIRIKNASNKFHENYINGKIKVKRSPHSKETKEKLSKLRSDYLSNTENSGGFKDIKWYKVKNVKNEEFIVRGLWEYNIAQKLNELNILWIRNKYLNYFIDDIQKTYNPDFYLPEYDEYIEVKGYFSDKDKIKMDAVLDQNPNVKIYFIQQQNYLDFINDLIELKDIPIYEFNKFDSGYKKKGIQKIKSSIHYCLICGKEIKNKDQKYCSTECMYKNTRKIKISNEEKINLLKTKSIPEIAKLYNISYNAVKKWKIHLLSEK